MKTTAIVPALIALTAAGCGNQMMRQPSFQPLDIPRAAPAQTAVPAAVDITPTDGLPAPPRAFGEPKIASQEAVDEYAQAGWTEPPLPPANLSDQARYEATPKAVDSLKPPDQFTRMTAQAGHDLFLARCVQCHNASGYGYGPVGEYLLPHPPDLGSKLVQKRSDGAIFWHISMGQGKMPAFAPWTTVPQRWSLTAYVRSLKSATPGSEFSDTLSAPYPVYGERGFEVGDKTYAWQESARPAPRKDVRGPLFAQWAHDVKQGGSHAP